MGLCIQRKQSLPTRHDFYLRRRRKSDLLSLPGCPGECGNLTIPFPFGMSSGCYFDDSFHIICNSSFKPPRPFLRLKSAEVVSISLDGKLELLNSSLVKRDVESAPVVVGWAAGNVACHVARNSSSRYACRSLQSRCTDSSVGQGYICQCLSGYQGNPYLVDGCQDIDECSVSNPCEGVCINLPGSFKCYCAKGLVGDGRKNGTGCHTEDQISWSASVYLPIGVIVMAPVLATTWITWMDKKKKLEKLREDLFDRNGGNLLRRKLSRRKSLQLRIYTTQEMKAITNSYGDKTVMLRCKPGAFYLGTLCNAEVAVVKVERVAESHIELFVDQLVFLSQPHKNLVRVLGCCLETQSPLVVYELHGDGNATLSDARLSCENRVKAAAGVARGLAYLNSHKFKTTFVHGSICSANILIDDSYDPKIFYAAGSNLITRVPDQENYVYLDPEPLNKKSDVYSFGVVLVKLLTGGRVISPNRGENDRRMALDFIFFAKASRLGEILDEEMVGGGEVVREVVALAERCLNVRPDKRPNMKEVSAKLTSLMQMA